MPFSNRPVVSAVPFAFALMVLLHGAQPSACRAQTPQEITGVSGEALRGFTERLSQAIANQSVADANACVDWSAVVDTALEGLLSNSPQARGFARGAKQGVLGSVNNASSFMGQVVKEANTEGNSYRLLRFHVKDGKAHALFRLAAGGGLNYHDYQLEERQGEVVATDIYVFTTGEQLTSSFRRAFLPAVQQLNKSWVGKLFASDQALLDNYQLFAQMGVLTSQGQGQAALDIYDRLPSELQRMKMSLTIRYQAASQVGDEALLAAIDAFEEAYPGDPALLLISLDGLILRKDYEKALASVEKLDEAVGGDAYLNLYRTSIELMRGGNAAALRHCRALVEGLPDELEHRWTLVDLLLKEEDYAAVYRALADIETLFEMEWNDLRETPAYAGFAASPEGKRWLREHGFVASGTEAATTEAAEPEPAARLTWSDKTGEFTIEADFVGVDTRKKTVKLKKADGKVIAVPIQRLNDESRAQAKRLYAEQKAAAGS